MLVGLWHNKLVNFIIATRLDFKNGTMINIAFIVVGGFECGSSKLMGGVVAHVTGVHIDSAHDVGVGYEGMGLGFVVGGGRFAIEFRLF